MKINKNLRKKILVWAKRFSKIVIKIEREIAKKKRALAIPNLFKTTKARVATLATLVLIVSISSYFFITSSDEPSTEKVVESRGDSKTEEVEKDSLADRESVDEMVDRFKDKYKIEEREEETDIKKDEKKAEKNIEKKESQKESKKEVIDSIYRPKLVIIMDDIQTKSQIKKLENLNLKITPSIFPKTVSNPETPNIAKGYSNFMIHLPLEAKNFYQAEHRWIKVGDSREEIEAYISEIKRDFPDAKYINNHTGSRYTESKEDMLLLLDVLKKYNITFVDSRTTPESVLPDISDETFRLIMFRDVFLDNVVEKSEITSYLKNAISIAKKNGYAIAICHPHDETFKALLESKELLKDVDLLYIKELEDYLKKTKVSHYYQGAKK